LALKRSGDNDVDAGDHHQPVDPFVAERPFGDRAVDCDRLLVGQIHLAQTAVDRVLLMDRQLELREPPPASAAQASGPAATASTAAANRQVNACLHIAVTQARVDPRAGAFLECKMAEGKTTREARRALKRHLSDVVYRRLSTWAE
jgi:hypothetical protein